MKNYVRLVYGAKVKYIRDLALKTSNKEINLSDLPALVNEDVFSFGDLGLKTALINLYGLDTSNKFFLEQVSAITEKWQPFRSFGSLALWKSLEK